MKKTINIKSLILTSLIISISLTTVGCNNTKNAKKNTITETKVAQEKVNFPITANITAGSTVTLPNAVVSSEKGKDPVLSVGKNSVEQQVSFNLNKFDEDKDAYIYINKRFVDKVKVGKETEQYVLFKEADLTEGNKVMQVVQFENNDTSKSVVKYNEVKFSLKYK